MFLLRYAAIALALIAIAWPSTPPTARASLAGSEWRVVEIAGAPAPVTGTLRFTLTSIRGKAACNAFFGAFRESDGNIEIAGINETGNICSGHFLLSEAGRTIKNCSLFEIDLISEFIAQTREHECQHASSRLESLLVIY